MRRRNECPALHAPETQASSDYLTLTLSALAHSLHAQCTQQPPNNLWAVPTGSVVYYSIDSSATSLPALSTATSLAAQISAAFAGWSTANAQSGGDGTTFLPATATNPATVIVNANLTYTTGGLVAQTQPETDGVINASNTATIAFHPNAVIPGSNNTNFFQALQTGYGTAYLEAALHEIGHLQGIGDYNPPTSAPAPGPDTSVVTPFIGINDIGNTYQKQRQLRATCNKQLAVLEQSIQRKS